MKNILTSKAMRDRERVGQREEREKGGRKKEEREREKVTFCDPEVRAGQCVLDDIRGNRTHPPFQKFA